MFTKLRVKNFKNWSDTLDFRLAPITVFFGVNSAGKSSILQFLLMLRQTAESPDRRRVLHPGDSHTPVELGTYRDLVFKHDLTKEIEFFLEWKTPEDLILKDPITQQSFHGDRLSFHARIQSDDSGARQRVSSLDYSLQNTNERLFVEMQKVNTAKDKYALSAEPYKLVRNQGRVWDLRDPIRFYGFPEEVSAYYQNAGFTSELVLALEQQLKRIQYLGPLRNVPKRSYIWSGEVPDHVGWAGDRAIEALLGASKRLISPGRKKRQRPFEAVVANWLQEMGLLESFEVKRIGEHRKEYEVLVRTRSSPTFVNLPDVGFGVSQILPVIVQCFYSQPHTTILLEQPEIHLHPAVQMTLADLFIETIRSREDGEDRSVQLIIESHSEHLLRRLQRRLADRTISPEDVALYWCKIGPEGAILEPLRTNLLGDVENWPDNFFGDEMGEMTARLEAAASQSPERTPAS